VLCERVWGDDWVHDDHVVDVHIANLRKKIDRGGAPHIRTVRGVGYRMHDVSGAAASVEPAGTR
jgi:DNA-binding response OmpR family regulator